MKIFSRFRDGSIGGIDKVVKKHQTNKLKDIFNEPLAIIGLNCQFPGLESDIEDIEAFHAMLIAGQSPIKEVPKSRWDVDTYYDPDRAKTDKMVTRWGGFLNNPNLFDSDFFRLSPAEIKQIDPQHRLFLEVSIRALNHANITTDSLKGSNTGVYCGISTHDYSQLNFKDHIQFNEYTQIGAANSAAAGRLSHYLHLSGPSLSVDTACSSSLSALYIAATALRTHQTDMAIVGGVHLNLCPENFIGLTKANMLSARGQCSSFDEKADGFVRSEGCGVVIVKRLSDAIKDGNTIHAVIKSIVMNQNGDGISLVAPNEEAQIALHQAVLDQANLQASDIDYIETHGTGTVIGDSVEFHAIQTIHQGHHSKDKPLLIGALKSNFGHSISSSGIASLIKVVNALKHEVIPPNLHYSTPNKSIAPETIPAVIPVNSTPFNKQKNKKRFVQVSNFGFGGTNVSVLVEEPPTLELHSSNHDEPNCFVISAHTENSLKQMMASYVPFLKKASFSLNDICYTLINCRDHYKFRCAILVNGKKDLIEKIESHDYEIVKVVVQKDKKTIHDKHQIMTEYLLGANIRLETSGIHYNPVALPLYCFDRKPFWHEPRNVQSNIQKPEAPLHDSIQGLHAEPIAIIGMSCRFPKAANVDEFLSLLMKGEGGMRDIPLERWDNSLYYDPDVNAIGRLYIKQLGLLDNIKTFDADFFHISPREAKFMAPQLRIIMETSYHALEDANLPLEKLKGSYTGVFIGVSHNEYPRVLENFGLTLDDLNIYHATGNALNALAGRVAYTFDFHGPIQVVDTACSSSMTAIHNACLSLQAGDCTMALAGGINLILSPSGNIMLSKAKMLSPESRCKTFSDDADGYARSEGCGIIVLKPLSAAIKDNDRILAVIKSSSINSDGKSEGFTVPNGRAQEEVIRSALAKANLSPHDIDYIEAHGTGTPVADPIEFNTLTKIFSDSHSHEKPLYISSVKTNIGHCESASGVASIIKTVLSLQTQTLFKHLNFKKLNPEIELKNTIIPLETLNWQKNGLRAAGVSSFGFSGANAHMILQQPPVLKKELRTLPEYSLLVLSAKSRAALQLLLASYQKYLLNTSDQFADICYTAATCRSHFLFRIAIKAKTAAEAAEIIENNKVSIHHISKEKESVQPLKTISQLQTAYEEGFIINWADYYKGLDVKFEKVKLPLYEFDRKEYWFENKEKLKESPIPKDWCFQLQWQDQLLNKTNHKIQGSRWLLMGASHLAQNFISQGLSIYLEEDEISLDKLSGIIFVAGLDSTSEIHSKFDYDFQKNTIKKLLALVKELNHKKIELRLIVLTSNAIPELPVGNLNINLSPLVGFCKTLVLELPQFQTILIDLDNMNHEVLTERVIHEIKYNHGEYYEHVVTYRDDNRLVSRLNKVPLVDKKIKIQGKGRYLITGGCGGLGLITAQSLLSAGARDLVLTSRNITKPEIKEAIKKLKTAYPQRTIQAISLDITDKEKLAALLSDINSDGLLKGIVHAAGAAIKAPLIDHQEKDVDYLFSAKVQGGWYLHELSQHCELDFFVVYSSIASVFGSNKESVYSATNSFLDALIAERHQLGLVGCAIQWGPWGEAGMSVKRSRDQALKQALLTNEQGHALIKVLLNSHLNFATIISPEYLRFMLDFVTKPRPAFYQCLADDLRLAKDFKDPLQISNESLSPWLQEYLKTPEEIRLHACKEMVKGICKEILELSLADSLDEEEGFFEIGFDSLMMTELASALKKILEPSMKVLATVGFNYPSINKLAQYIESEISTQLIKQKDVSLPKQEEDAIAIIGMSCSLPNAPDIVSFERLLEEGLSGIQDIPIERWDNRKYYDPNKEAPRKSYVNKMGLIENIKSFDANFFGISPREAKLIDPQQRIFLECSYKALEHANYPPDSLRGSLTGVFAGVGPNEYYATLEKSGFSNEELSGFSITGNVLNLIPGRVAYTFDFKGPSISIDTSCSSSLVAIHYACNSLKNRETDLALAGGVNILLMPESNITLCKANALSVDGQCKTFDADADGYARGEGCGVMVLKRLSDALRDKNRIFAVIKASAVNNDGKAAGLTVPNGLSQEAVMMKALSQTDLASSDISYIEAHGTGTPLGDPIEAHSIYNVYGKQRSEDNPLYLGTVKTNIGHLEAASGAAGVIKTVISLQKNKIYKHLNFKQLNPNIHITNTEIALKNTPWNSNSKLKIAGVNAFGFSGTNAHLILQEYPQEPVQKKAIDNQMQVLVLSAKSKTALINLAKQYQQYLSTTEHDLSDICYTAATCRDHYTYRLALVAQNADHASQLLAAGQFALSYGENNLVHISLNPTLQSLLNEYLQGQAVNWLSYYKNSGNDYIKVLLPHYAFDRTEFWTDKKTESHSHLSQQLHPLLEQMLPMPGNEYLFSHQLDLEHLSYLKQYRVFDKTLFPATAYIELGLAAAKAILKHQTVCIEQFHTENPLYSKQDLALQLQVKPLTNNDYSLKIFAQQDSHWQLCSAMTVHSINRPEPEFVDLDALKKHFDHSVDIKQVYKEINKEVLYYGDEFQVLQKGYVSADSALSHVVLRKESASQGYHYHPALLEGAIQTVSLLNNKSSEKNSYLPYAFTQMTPLQDAPSSLWVYVMKRDEQVNNELCVDIKLYDNSGLLVGTIEELKLKLVTRCDFISYESILQNLYLTSWEEWKENIPPAELPKFWVISNNPIKAQNILGSVNYQLVSEIHELKDIKNKNILFLYEQGQFMDLVHCCQKLFITRPLSFILVTENAYAIHDNEGVNPYHTMASAFWKSFRNEIQLHQNFTVDLDGNSSLTGALECLFGGKHQEDQLVVRNTIYLPRLTKTEGPIDSHKQLMCFDSDVSYLITGGTGGLAKPLIEYLIHRGAKNIIITSRSDCLSEDFKRFIESTKLKQINIEHYAVDASNYQQMEKIVQHIDQGLKPLKGIFHLAGVVKDGLIVNLNDENFQTVLNAKMESALILHQLTKNKPLDLFVMFSSFASLLGAKGQSNYVAANGFLDGLAHLRKQQGLPALVINWGPFNEIGMTTHLTPALKQLGFIPLDKDSIDILDVLLKSKLTQIAPCPINWEVFFKHSPKQIELSKLGEALDRPNQYFLRSLKQRSKDECVAILSSVLIEITGNVLRIEELEQINAHGDLLSLGLDSLMSIEVRNQIHDKLQCPNLSLSIEYFINNPTIDNIARNITEEIQAMVDRDTTNQMVDPLADEEIALCDFQYIFWAINQLNYSYNTAMQMQLHGKLNKDYLNQAFDFVVNQHPVFWMSFDKDKPTQKLNRQGQFKLYYEDISLNNEADLNQTFYYNMMGFIPLTEQPLIRVYLYKINNDLHELHLVFPHIIVDDTSCDIVFNQFKQAYEKLTLGQELKQIAEKESFLSYVKHNNLHYEKNLKEKIDFWTNYNKGCTPLNFGSDYHLADAATYQPKHLFHYPIATPAIDYFINWHKEKNINISSGLIAACQIVFHKMSQQNKIPILLIHTGREGSLYKSMVGLFSEYKRINMSFNAAHQFIDCVKAIDDQLLKTAPFQKCSLFIKNKGLQGVRFSISQFVALKWNKLVRSNYFKESKLQPLIIDNYLEYLSRIVATKINTKIKNKINKLFKWNMPIQKPAGLKVLINMTAGFFKKDSENNHFADLEYSFPNYYGGLDRPIGNQTLWVYFTKNSRGEHILSINGPLTTECKDQIALNFNQLIEKFKENNTASVVDLVN